MVILSNVKVILSKAIVVKVNVSIAKFTVIFAKGQDHHYEAQRHTYKGQSHPCKSNLNRDQGQPIQIMGQCSGCYGRLPEELGVSKYPRLPDRLWNRQTIPGCKCVGLASQGVG